MITRTALLLGAALFTASDVVPHCGGPEVIVRAPGEHCGAQGKHYDLRCRAPAECIDTQSRGRECTRTCTADADCTVLGAGFTCATSEDPRVCVRPVP